jgi:DNA-binding NarL/FixJ family response regulator
MINEFKETEIVRESGIIYRSTFNQIKSIYQTNPQQAGELAISAIELLLTGQISSDDNMINIILEQNKEINSKNIHNYELRAEIRKQNKIAEQKLDEIARLSLMKKTQKEIATKLGLSQQTVSNRMALIRREYPELLQVSEPVQEKNACTS